MRLHLLCEAASHSSSVMLVGDKKWELKEFDLDELETAGLDFLCVSYTWGEGRAPSPVHPGFNISDRTIPALAAVAGLRPKARLIWIDALCVPQEPEERFFTLESMGYIYSLAREVVVILSAECLPALKYMAQEKRLAPEYFNLLENEDWVTRAWTYQEAVNARSLYITCEGAVDVILAGEDLLNYVGHALSKLTIPPLERRQHFPRLDALEELVDYLTADYEERSALQVMSKMDLRTQQRPEDHFFAMIGAISRIRASDFGSRDPCEVFMRICETKGDYSFIYSASPRETARGKRWRPVTADLPAILPWHCEGACQPGREAGGVLFLDQIVQLDRGSLSSAAAKFIAGWLGAALRRKPLESNTELSEAIHAALRAMGFRGPGDFIETPSGLMFTLDKLTEASINRIMVSGSLLWSFGAPGLVETSQEGCSLYTPGIFVGSTRNLSRVSVELH